MSSNVSKLVRDSEHGTEVSTEARLRLGAIINSSYLPSLARWRTATPGSAIICNASGSGIILLRRYLLRIALVCPRISGIASVAPTVVALGIGSRPWPWSWPNRWSGPWPWPNRWSGPWPCRGGLVEIRYLLGRLNETISC